MISSLVKTRAKPLVLLWTGSRALKNPGVQSTDQSDLSVLCLVSVKALANEDTFVADTLVLMMFLGLHKLGNICCGHKMFLNKIRNIFGFPDTKFASATNVKRAGKRGNICVGNNVSATMCPRLTFR